MNIEELRDQLISANQLSGQSSFDRRMPSKKSIPLFIEIRRKLKGILEIDASNADAWKLLSQSEEALLNYREAIDSFTKYLNFKGRDKKDLKRLALLKESQGEWEDLILAPKELKELGDYLNSNLSRITCDHSLVITRKYLEEKYSKVELKRIITALQNHGGFCDCEVLANVTL
ncbi:DUF2695 domain-containing protein [Leptospira haakeii]|uniref:DUF2695 domain-containing protein n=1 Tax=Leptospira haakeii TaxID=2023198 RepID=A0ABX4PEY4_9LEPT|nr:DUF2695 domain-containing protein [Leptospira haakeii]PKA14337.1 hypothetical protein CH363_19255 [Leptospira haakeii]PKA18195.1 hypothetical protein CH377_19010 [Leptospira haakeii]